MSKPSRQNNPSDLRRTLEASGGLRELTPKISALGAHEGPLHVDHRLRVPDLGLRRPSKRERAERNLPLGSTSSRVCCPGLPFLARPTLRPRALKKGGSVLGLVSGPGQHTSFSVGSLSGPPGGPCFFFSSVFFLLRALRLPHTFALAAASAQAAIPGLVSGAERPTAGDFSASGALASFLAYTNIRASRNTQALAMCMELSQHLLLAMSVLLATSFSAVCIFCNFVFHFMQT